MSASVSPKSSESKSLQPSETHRRKLLTPEIGSGGIFSKLRRGRSKLSFKEDDDTKSRASTVGRSFDGPPSKGTPSLALPLSFANASQTNLVEDTGISQYLSPQSETRTAPAITPTSAPHGAASPAPYSQPERPTTSTSYRPSTAQPATSVGADEYGARSNYGAEERSWQSRVVTEMKEKEQLISRFEALSRVHMALQEEVEKERTRADKAEAAARKKDPSFGRKSEANGTASTANGVAAGSAGAAVGATAGSAITREHDEKMARERDELQQQQKDFERQREEVRQAKADTERERTIMQTQRAEIERQKETHTSLLAEREQEKSSQAAAQSGYVRDREAQASQLSEINTQLTEVNLQLSATKAGLDKSHTEVSRLNEQNEALRLNLAKSAQGPAQATDAELAELMRGLSTDVQNWVTNNFSKSRLDFEKLEKAGDSKELKQIRSAVPQYRKAAEKAKVPFLQALVSARLMDAVWDDDFYVALPDWEEEHETKEETGRGGLSYLREAYKVLSGHSASNTTELHAWRASTVSILRHTHDPGLTGLTNKLISRTAFSINNLLSSITSASGGIGATAQGSSPLPSRVRDLQAFIAKAIDIARQFRAQRAVFEFSLPGSVESSDGLARTTPFDEVAMSDVLEEGYGESGIVLAAAWPLVMRVGGEGAVKGEKSVVLRAGVICGASA